MDSDLESAVAILAGTASKAPQQARFTKGFGFEPRAGHVLVLGADQASHIEHAVRARIKLFPGSAITLGLSVKFESVAGDWSDEYRLVYSPGMDSRRAAPFAGNIESFLLPKEATQLDLVAVDETGVRITSRRCVIPVAFFREVNARVQRARGFTFRLWQIQQQETIVSRDMKTETPVHNVVVDLFDAE